MPISTLYLVVSTFFQEIQDEQKCCDKSGDGKEPDENDEVVKLENRNSNRNQILGNIQTFGQNIIHSFRRFK